MPISTGSNSDEPCTDNLGLCYKAGNWSIAIGCLVNRSARLLPTQSLRLLLSQNSCLYSTTDRCPMDLLLNWKEGRLLGCALPPASSSVWMQHDGSEHLILKGDSALCEGRARLQTAALHRRGDSCDTRSRSMPATSRGTKTNRLRIHKPVSF